MDGQQPPQTTRNNPQVLAALLLVGKATNIDEQLLARRIPGAILLFLALHFVELTCFYQNQHIRGGNLMNYTSPESPHSTPTIPKRPNYGVPEENEDSSIYIVYKIEIPYRYCNGLLKDHFLQFRSLQSSRPCTAGLEKNIK